MGRMASSKKVWLITGASRGLGLALTRRVLARGGSVIGTARDASAFAELQADTTIDQANFFPLVMDVTWSFDRLRSAMDRAITRWGHIDVLVNNAGMGNIRPTEECSAADLLSLLSTNFLGVIGVTNALLPHFRTRRSGKVIIIGSRSAYHNEYMGPGAYAATKAAVHAYGETLSAEMRPFNVGVMIVAPGAFESGMRIPIEPGPIADYDPIRQKIGQVFAAREKDDTRGSPLKGMDCIVDVVNGEGRAEGRTEMPLWLFLGDDAISNVRARLEKMTRTIDEWECVGSRVSKVDC